jgi:hypothetical protein
MDQGMSFDRNELKFVYRLYGLAVYSQLELPELAAASDAEAEACGGRVTIRLGRVPIHLPDAKRIEGLLECRPGICHYDFEEAGRYLVAHGEEITVDPREGVGDNDVRAYLFGSVFGTLLHQRKLVPLHVSSVATPKGLVAFTGGSGAGKSTMAGMLHRLTGWPMFCDDVAVVHPHEQLPLLRAGMLRLKLWKDAVEMIGAGPDRLTRDVARYDKFHVHAPEMFDQQRTMPLAALFELREGEEVEITPVTGFHSFELVTRTIYRPYLVKLFSDLDMVTRRCAELASNIESYTLRRPWSVQGLGQSVAVIAEKLSGDKYGS